MLEYYLVESDEKSEETLTREEKLRAFEHIYNPLHLYSRLIDQVGLSKEDAMIAAKNYEELFYKNLVKNYLQKNRKLESLVINKASLGGEDGVN